MLSEEKETSAEDKEGVAPAYIKMVRVPVWVVRVASGMMMILTFSAAASVVLFLVVLMWCVMAIVNQNKRIEKLNKEFTKEAKAASKERARVVEDIEKIVDPMLRKEN